MSTVFLIKGIKKKVMWHLTASKTSILTYKITWYKLSKKKEENKICAMIKIKYKWAEKNEKKSLSGIYMSR